MTLVDDPLLHLGFASLHVLAGHLGAAGLHYLRYGRNPLVLYRGTPSRHQQVTRVVSLVAAVWTAALAGSALWPAFRSLSSPIGAVPAAFSWAVALLGMVVMVAAQATMGPSFRVGQDPADAPTALRSGGLHAVCRNPIYVGSWLSLAGMTLWWPSPVLVASCAGLGIGMHLLVLEEERFLRLRFGIKYDIYCCRAGRYFPTVRLPVRAKVEE